MGRRFYAALADQSERATLPFLITMIFLVALRRIAKKEHRSLDGIQIGK